MAFASGVDLGDGDQAMAPRIVGEVGEAGGRGVRDPLRGLARLQRVDVLVLVVDEVDRAADGQELAAAVFVHARAGRERSGQQLRHGAGRIGLEDRLPAALLGPRLAPIDGAAGGLHRAEAAARLGGDLGADRRRPGAEGQRFLGGHGDLERVREVRRHPRAIRHGLAL